MQGVRVVDGVHGQGLGIVVDRDVHGAAEGFFKACACAATAGEVVDDQFTREVEGEGECVAFHAACSGCCVMGCAKWAQGGNWVFS